MSSTGPTTDKAQRRAKFEAAFETIRDELVAHMEGEHMPKEAVEWFTANLNYNVPGGKLNRGMSVVDTVEIIKRRALTEDEYFKAAVLGWCIELLQAFFLVSDDMMDASITRRGQPCWYRAPGIGMIAINDSFMLEGALYHLLKKHFRKESFYADLLDLFHETTYQTEFGQLVDLITAPEGSVDMSRFSLERHRLIVIYKTAFYSFYLPVACALMMCGVPYPHDDPPSFSLEGTSLSPVGSAGAGPQSDGATTTTNQTQKKKKKSDPYSLALSILIPLGEYFQVQDDFLDFSAPPEVLGKIGTDIVDNKCSWVINTALLLTAPTSASTSSDSDSDSPANPNPNPFNPDLTKERLAELRVVLETNYARKDVDPVTGANEHERKVKEAFEELGIRGAYKAYEERVVGVLRERIRAIDEGLGDGGEGEGGEGVLRGEVFESFLGKIYGRSK